MKKYRIFNPYKWETHAGFIPTTYKELDAWEDEHCSLSTGVDTKEQVNFVVEVAMNECDAELQYVMLDGV